MDIKTELLRNCITDFINGRLEDFEIDADKIADSHAIEMLAEIQKIIKNDEYTDFDVVEKIVCLFEKHNISAGTRHDF